MELRREFQLSEDDEDCLAACEREWETIVVGDARWLILPGYPIPDAYNHQAATAALRIPASYPDVQIDMVCFEPHLALKSGRTINNLSDLPLDKKTFQQWSRHRTETNPWRPDLDNICTHLLQVDSWLAREIR